MNAGWSIWCLPQIVQRSSDHLGCGGDNGDGRQKEKKKPEQNQR